MYALLTLDVARDAVAEQFSYGEPLSSVVEAEELAPVAPRTRSRAGRPAAPRRRSRRSAGLEPGPLTPRSGKPVTRDHAAGEPGYSDGVARVTLQTIADQVGVSRMTVSNAFSRPGPALRGAAADDPRRRRGARVRRPRPGRPGAGPRHHRRRRHPAHRRRCATRSTTRWPPASSAPSPTSSRRPAWP